MGFQRNVAEIAGDGDTGGRHYEVRCAERGDTGLHCGLGLICFGDIGRKRENALRWILEMRRDVRGCLGEQLLAPRDQR